MLHAVPFMLLRPGITLVRGLSFSRKFLLMGAVLLLPLAALMVHAIAGLHARWQVTHAKRQGSAVLAASLDGVRHAQTHGGLVSRALAGAPACRRHCNLRATR